MPDTISIKPPAWFWAVGVLLLLWSLAGIFACYSQLTMGPEQLAALEPAQRDAFLAMPGAIKIAYAAAVLSGLLGSILLLVRKALARPAFIVSLVAVVVQFGWVFGIYGGLSKFGGIASAAFPAFIVLIAVLEIWFAGKAARNGWLS